MVSALAQALRGGLRIRTVQTRGSEALLLPPHSSALKSTEATRVPPPGPCRAGTSRRSFYRDPSPAASGGGRLPALQTDGSLGFCRTLVSPWAGWGGGVTAHQRQAVSVQNAKPVTETTDSKLNVQLLAKNVVAFCW